MRLAAYAALWGLLWLAYLARAYQSQDALLRRIDRAYYHMPIRTRWWADLPELLLDVGRQLHARVRARLR